MTIRILVCHGILSLLLQGCHLLIELIDKLFLTSNGRVVHTYCRRSSKLGLARLRQSCAVETTNNSNEGAPIRRSPRTGRCLPETIAPKRDKAAFVSNGCGMKETGGNIDKACYLLSHAPTWLQLLDPKAYRLPVAFTMTRVCESEDIVFFVSTVDSNGLTNLNALLTDWPWNTTHCFGLHKCGATWSWEGTKFNACNGIMIVET